MKKIVLSLSLAITLPVSSTDFNLTKECNMMRNGDELIKHQIAYKNPGNPGKELLWDFSNIDVGNNYYRVIHISPNDTTFAVIEDGTMFKYSCPNDTLTAIGYENRLTFFQDSIPEPIFIFPFGYNNLTSGNFCITGRYAQDRDVISIGKTKTEADACGSMILPTLDTLNNVLRIHTERRAWIKLLTSSESIQDSLDCDSLTEYRRQSWQWYAQGFRYPIFESQIHEIYNWGKKTGEYRTSFYYSPYEQIQLPADNKNEEIREYLYNGKYSPWNKNPQKQMRISNKDNASNRFCLGTTEEFNATMDDSNIHIYYRIENGNAEIELYLTNLKGQLYEYIPKQIYSAGTYEIDINCNNLVPGEYLLSLFSNGIRHTKKILHH